MHHEVIIGTGNVPNSSVTCLNKPYISHNKVLFDCLVEHVYVYMKIFKHTEEGAYLQQMITDQAPPDQISEWLLAQYVKHCPVDTLVGVIQNIVAKAEQKGHRMRARIIQDALMLDDDS
jgi:hypothetical protein